VRNLLVDFALAEAAYTVVRIIQEFASVRIPDDEPAELLGFENQALKLTMLIDQGCRVLIE
jgi:hypothetical protein